MKIKIGKQRTFTYAEEGLIATHDVGEGRMIPAIVLDVQDNKDIVDLISLHYSITAGDVTMTWIQDFLNRSIFIFYMEFKKPMQIEFGIKFDISKDYALIDGMVQSKGFYLMTGKKGDKISTKLNDERILVEVPDLGIKGIWDKLFLKVISEKYRKNGYSKRESKEVAKEYIKSIREVWKLRCNN